MDDNFTNRLDWLTLVAAFAIWLMHFMLAWSISSVFPDQPIVLWLTLALTGLALGLLAWLWLRRDRPPLRSFSGLVLAIATLAVLFDFTPALMA